MGYISVWLGLIILTAAIAVACATPEPIIEEIEVTVEVTKIVPQTVEVPVTMVVQQTVEVPVTRPVPQTVEIPVTRIITRLVVATPKPTATLKPTPRPTTEPTATPTPPPTLTPTPEPLDLTTAETGNLFVLLSNDGEGLIVKASPAFDVDVYDLDVLVDGSEYCNTVRIYSDDGPVELSCEYEQRPHSSVQRVSVQTPYGDLRCGKHVESTSQFTMFLCVFR